MTVPTLIAAFRARQVTLAAEYSNALRIIPQGSGVAGASTEWLFVLRLSGTCPC